jgi:hypothetical protein
VASYAHIIAATAIIAVPCVDIARSETLRFTGPSEGWWYTDESYGSNTDGSLMLAIQSNDPKQLPLYFFCKDDRYSVLFRPPTSTTPSKSPSDQLEYHYTIYLDYFDANARWARGWNVRTPALEDGRATRVELKTDALVWLMSAQWTIMIKYGPERFTDRVIYPSPPLRFFVDRCTDRLRRHNPPPPPQ